MGLIFSVLTLTEAWSSGNAARGAHRYRLLAFQEGRVRVVQIQSTWEQRKKAIISTTMVAAGLALVTFLWVAVHNANVRAYPHSYSSPSPTRPASECDTPEDGFTCSPDLSHLWGQYSPFYSVPSDIDTALPDSCRVISAQVLSRHGARDPTAGKTEVYKTLVKEIQRKVTHYPQPYEFIKSFKYTLGSDQLTPFGQQQMVNSGINFYNRYRDLAQHNPPFVRASGQERVVESAEKFNQGYHSALVQDNGADVPHPLPYPILAIPEDVTSNNTMKHGLCNAFESPDKYYNGISSHAQATYAETFIPPILARFTADLGGFKLSTNDIISLMDLCPFTTVAPPYQPSSSNPGISPWCSIFTKSEWKHYDYYQTLGKFYGYGPGNPLGPTQGVGYVNELIARMTSTPVEDRTSTNSTLDRNSTTFPLHRKLYADFSHDNDMVAIISALKLYPNVTLSNTTRMTEDESGGFSARWTVPFAGRIYFEKINCGGEKDYVRVLVNDRVVEMSGCTGKALVGMCEINEWADLLGWAKKGGEWDVCFAK